MSRDCGRGGEGGGAAYLVGERAVEGDGVRLEYVLELGAHGGGRLEGREASGFRGVVAPVVRGGGGHEASASAKKSPVFAVHIRRDGNAGRASRATGRVASTRAPRVHRPAPCYTRGWVEMRVRRHGQTGARVSRLRLARSLTHALKPFRRRLGETTPAPKNPAKRRGRVGKSAVVGAVTRGCRAMTAMVSSMTRRHLDRPRVSVVQAHGMTITRAPTARPRTKIYHVGNREIPKQILERHLSSRGWKIGSNRVWCVTGGGR